MATIGPVTCSIGPGAVTPDGRQCTLWDSGPIGTNSVSSVTVDGTITFSGGRNDAVWDMRATGFSAAGAVVDNNLLLTTNRLTTLHATGIYRPSPGVARILVQFGGALYAGQTMSCTATLNTQTVVPCQYGTQLTSLANGALVLTSDVITAVCAEFDAPWLAVVFNPILYFVFDAQKMCSTGPIAPPPIGPNLLQASVDLVLELFASMAWFLYCECIPGSPAPAAPTAPTLTQPSIWPTTPTFPCDPAALCASIVRIEQTLAAVAQTLGVDYQLTTLLQRYRLPFAYIKGAVHSGLTGEGSFAVSRLLGLLVEITTVDAGQPVLAGNPPYLFDQGWMSVSEVNGMLEEKRITRSQFTWLPASMATADHFNWHLFDGVTLRVTELEAEP